MKTRKVDGSELASERIQQARERQEQNAARTAGEQAGKVAQEGTVNLTLGKAIQELLKEGEFQSERQAKVERIREQIKAGTYAPRSEDVAQSLVEEIGLEIATSRAQAANEE